MGLTIFGQDKKIPPVSITVATLCVAAAVWRWWGTAGVVPFFPIIITILYEQRNRAVTYHFRQLPSRGVRRKMEEIKEVNNLIQTWGADINEHRNGFVASDRNRAFVIAFIKELDTAHNVVRI